MRRVVAVAVSVVVLFPACGGGGGDRNGGEADDQTPSTDRFGNPIKTGEDWAAGSPGSAGSGKSGGTGSGDASASGAARSGTPTTQLVCERPEPPEFDPTQAPPGFDPNAPLAEAQDDFPLEVSMRPTKADAGATLEITAIAVAAPSRVLVVVLAHFIDRESHGMQAAKFADATGRAVFKGPIPRDAPEGFASVTVSATTEDDRSAIETLDFTVTGERCT